MFHISRATGEIASARFRVSFALENAHNSRPNLNRDLSAFSFLGGKSACTYALVCRGRCPHRPAQNALFCGDHIMGWSSTVVLPPDGNMTLYMENLQKIADLKFDILYPTHGAPIVQPNDYINALINHRLERDEQIIRCIEKGLVGLDEILLAIYPELNPALHSAARKNIQAHLLRLIDLGLVKNIWFD